MAGFGVISVRMWPCFLADRSGCVISLLHISQVDLKELRKRPAHLNVTAARYLATQILWARTEKYSCFAPVSSRKRRIWDIVLRKQLRTPLECNQSWIQELLFKDPCLFLQQRCWCPQCTRTLRKKLVSEVEIRWLDHWCYITQVQYLCKLLPGFTALNSLSPMCTSVRKYFQSRAPFRFC